MMRIPNLDSVEVRSKAREYYLKDYARHTDSYKKRAAKWAKRNPKKRRESRRKWYLANLDRYRQYAAERRQGVRRATPQWLTDEMKQETRMVYMAAQMLSWLYEGGLHVDHIIPINGKEVCGLHVPWNLQIMQAKDNRSKSNKVTP